MILSIRILRGFPVLPILRSGLVEYAVRSIEQFSSLDCSNSNLFAVNAHYLILQTNHGFCFHHPIRRSPLAEPQV